MGKQGGIAVFAGGEVGEVMAQINTPGIPVTGEDLRKAMDNLLAGHPISPDQKPSIGCNIKWKLD